MLNADYGGGMVPVGRAVFKTVEGLRSKPWWVRLPSIPASIF
jgi:hypothetical protein